MVFYKILLIFFEDLQNFVFFKSSGKTRSSNIDSNSSFSGKAIDFPHSCIIRIDILSQPWALFGLRFFLLLTECPLH